MNMKPSGAVAAPLGAFGEMRGSGVSAFDRRAAHVHAVPVPGCSAPPRSSYWWRGFPRSRRPGMRRALVQSNPLSWTMPVQLLSAMHARHASSRFRYRRLQRPSYRAMSAPGRLGRSSIRLDRGYLVAWQEGTAVAAVCKRLPSSSCESLAAFSYSAMRCCAAASWRSSTATRAAHALSSAAKDEFAPWPRISSGASMD